MGPEIIEGAPIHQIDVRTFTESQELGNGIPFLLQLKGFNRRERIARTKKQASQGASGSLTDRPVAPGALFGFDGLDGLEMLSEDTATIHHHLPDSRGIYTDGTHILFASVNTIHDIDLSTQTEQTIFYPWFAYIHSIAGDSDASHVLVTSPGFDRIVEIDRTTLQPSWEWSAWDHGLNKTKHTGRTVCSNRNPMPAGENVLVVDNPEVYQDGLGIPPGDRTAFPNSALYRTDNPQKILATLFHGGLIEIDKNTGEYKELFTHLKHPHGLMETEDGYIVTNTSDGSFLLLDQNLRIHTTVSLKHLGGKEDACEETEWLQNVRPLGNAVFAAIDSHRASLFIIDLERQLIRRVPYSPDWVVQDFFPLQNDTYQTLRAVL